jgi:hypothetical protein
LFFDDELGGDFSDLANVFIGEDNEDLNVADFLGQSNEAIFVVVLGALSTFNVVLESLGDNSLMLMLILTDLPQTTSDLMSLSSFLTL